ncbi:MAG TPA: hypothetical protein DCZ12_12065 [Gammaproteobacteria bacterium]|nr:hypothetical protein [Gammaproteobacteria bacterium]
MHSTATNIATPAARSGDPASSHAAADAVTGSGRRQTHIEVLEKYLAFFGAGLTSAELANRLVDSNPELNRHEVARRLADGKGLSFENVPAGDDLFADGEPVRNMRRCAVTGRSCLVWYPTAKALLKYGRAVGGEA